MGVVVEDAILINSMAETMRISLDSLMSRNLLEDSYHLDQSPELALQIVSDLLACCQAIQADF
jgi:uncharacterized heparinase superfamily protein